MSVGPKGSIQKVIQYQETELPGVFNLAFGDLDVENNTVDDTVISNNGDMEMVLSTVVKSLYQFYEHHPDAIVYASGSSHTRNRLYRMGISKYYEEITNDFYVLGQVDDMFIEFELIRDYIGFLAKKKKS